MAEINSIKAHKAAAKAASAKKAASLAETARL